VTRSVRDRPDIVDGLAKQGWCVAAGFLSKDHTEALAVEAREAESKGMLQPAGVGAGASRIVRLDVRGDHIVWLEPPGATAAQRQCLQQFEQVRLALNRELQLGLFDFECHLALYPSGTFYRRHLDRFASDDRRTVSCVLYLNPSWTAEDGGALRLYLADGSHIDVSPRAGTLVTFLSARFEHEVLPARRERLSLAGWFRRRA
jgi:SM-20-related protein